MAINYTKEEREKKIKEMAKEVVEKYKNELLINEIDYFLKIIENDLKFHENQPNSENEFNDKIVELIKQSNDKSDKIIDLLEIQHKTLFFYVAFQGLNVLPLLDKDLVEINEAVDEYRVRHGLVREK